MPRLFRTTLLAGIVLFVTSISTANAADPKGRKVTSVTNPTIGYPYRLWTPDTDKPPEAGWPLVVWLHGFSLRGDDLDKLAAYGPPAVLDKIEPRCSILAPQLPSSKLVWNRETLDQTLKAVLEKHTADRVYLSGASLGAAGACDWAAASPERFSGLVILAGAGNPSSAKALAGIPVRIFHGADDKTVTLAKARAMEKALKDAGGTVQFTELPEVGHDAERLTKAAFVEAKSIDWLLEQRGQTTVLPISAGSVAEVRDEAKELKARLAEFPHRVEIPTDDAIYQWIEGICATPHRRPGTDEGHQGEDWVVKQFEALKLDQVTRDRVPMRVWQPKTWKLTVDGKEVGCTFLLNSGFTPEAGVTAPLLFAERGQFKDADAKGRIVVVQAKIGEPSEDNSRAYFRVPADQKAASEVAFPSNMLGGFIPLKFIDAYERARKADAVGFLMLTRDMRTANGALYWPYDAEPKPLPGLYVGKKDSPAVETAAKAGKSATLVQTGTLSDGHMSNIWATLPGVSDEVILVTSHHDAAYQGAVEDGSGIAQVLAQAAAWSKLPREKRPRTLVFVAAAGHFHKGQGAHEFAKAHPELLKRCRAVLTLEHMPCKEVRLGKDGYEATGRVQPVHVYTSSHPALLASLWGAIDRKPPPFAVSVERPLLSVPLSDAAGYVGRSRERDSGFPSRDGIPYISWISAPLYLVDEADTLDKIERSKLSALAETVAEVVKGLMMLP